VKFYFDENWAPRIARALQILEQDQDIEIRNIMDDFGEGIADEDWIPRIGENKGLVITHDYNITRIRQQRELCKRYNLGIFIFKPPSKKGYKYWKMVEALINSWQNILQIAKNKKRPFICIIRPRSKRFINLNNI